MKRWFDVALGAALVVAWAAVALSASDATVIDAGALPEPAPSPVAQPLEATVRTTATL